MALIGFSKPDRSNRANHLLSTWAILSIYLSVILMFTGFAYISLMLPTPLYIKDELTYNDQFIGERAQIELEKFAGIGQKVAGSVENEKLSVEYIVNEVEKIAAARNPIHKIEVDVQIESGSFFLDFQPYGMTMVYESLRNVVIKFGPADHEPEHSVMINTHFDTVPVSPGAGDAGIMVVTMLEILRVLSKSSDTLQHSLVFLLNGSEENSLQGAHAFIAHHKWADKVRAFVNLDSSGNRGKEMMFQSSPDGPWLIEYYRKSSKHPLCSALGEELFQANLMPSDTDFRIFRDFGKVPGMDFALYENGYVYHTKYDVADTIPLGTYQHTGNNILALLKELGNAPEIENTKEFAGEKVVFFDILGKYMVHYTERQALILNLCVALTSIVVLGLSLLSMTTNSKLTTIKELAIAFIIQLMSIGLAVAIVLALAVFYDMIGRTMAWFTYPYLIFGMYFCPLFFGVAIGPVIFLKLRKKTTFTINHHIQLFMGAQCLIYVILLVFLTVMRIRSAFVVLVPVLFYTISVFLNWATTFQNRGFSWIYIHCLTQICPLIFFSQLTVFSFQAFIPTLGRDGPQNNPEILVAVFTIFYGLLIGGFLIPLISLAKKPILLVLIFAGIGALSLLIVAAGWMFPYREATNAQRFWVFHIDRKFHDIDKSIRLEDSGYFILDMDRNSPKSVESYVTNITTAYSLTEECQKELYCGMPMYKSRTHIQTEHSHYQLAPKPFLNQIPELKFVSMVPLSATIRRYTFTMTGPDHMGLFISPVLGAKLISWSFLDEIPRTGPIWQGRSTYFVYYFSTDTSYEYSFHLDFEVEGSWPNYLFDITHNGQFMHYDEERTVDFLEFIDSFPKWAHITSWMSSLESWKF